jgi:SmpA / OmlA family
MLLAWKRSPKYLVKCSMSMKLVRSIAIIVAIMALGIPRAGNAAGDDTPKIHKGMTEAQVEKLYGEPDTRTETESGTSWTYTKGMGKAMIPFYALFNNPIKIIVITFHDGRVVSYAVQH